MFHKTKKLEFKEGTTLHLTFQDGYVKSFDMSSLFKKYPEFKALSNRRLFLKGKLMRYGIIWNDQLDIEAETIYIDGKTIRKEEINTSTIVGNKIAIKRAEVGISQNELANMTGIDQSDISKIERGVANPSLATLDRIAKALNTKIDINLK